jgi:hypothetical protein
VGEVDAGGVGFAGAEPVAVADGAKAGDVGVGVVPKALGFFEKFESCGAEVHEYPPEMKGRPEAAMGWARSRSSRYGRDERATDTANCFPQACAWGATFCCRVCGQCG